MYKQLERYRKEGKPIRIAKYSRCSSDEQKKNGYTINDQLDLLEDFCQEYAKIIEKSTPHRFCGVACFFF